MVINIKKFKVRMVLATDKFINFKLKTVLFAMLQKKAESSYYSASIGPFDLKDLDR